MKLKLVQRNKNSQTDRRNLYDNGILVLFSPSLFPWRFDLNFTQSLPFHWHSMFAFSICSRFFSRYSVFLAEYGAPIFSLSPNVRSCLMLCVGEMKSLQWFVWTVWAWVWCRTVIEKHWQCRKYVETAKAPWTRSSLPL